MYHVGEQVTPQTFPTDRNGFDHAFVLQLEKSPRGDSAPGARRLEWD
jgi:hypothetical protein